MPIKAHEMEINGDGVAPFASTPIISPNNPTSPPETGPKNIPAIKQGM